MRRGTRFSAFVAVLLLPILAGCEKPTGGGGTPASSASPATSGPASESDVLATVNGIPIRISDLHYVLARERGREGKRVDASRAKDVLDTIIEQELARQQAAAQGLDTDAEYLRKLRFMQAPVNDFERSELSKALGRAQAQKAKVDDAEARKYFDDNREQLQTEVRVFQILLRNDEDKIRSLKQLIDAGKPFEEVAGSLLPPELPASARAPWDSGMLRWNRVPPPWREALAKMKEGDVSDVLRGEKNRTWIIKLVERRRNEAITYEQVRQDLIEQLQREKVEQLAEQSAKDRRSKAAIVRVREPGAMPPPPEPED